ncbi:MAG: hypothetical protein OEM67_02005 [Thermoleophilia bacterium]|nr:hypothetical protein [Thermoleophilia bacterium]MDH3724668.1 hypothetical protein [Thermoleophilia bacterium]
MIGLGRWMVAGAVALGAGVVAAVLSKRAGGADEPGPPRSAIDDPPPFGSGSDDPQAALDAARARLRQRADEVKTQLERHSD